ncbi:MAG: Inositol-1-monophosphatase [bacterium ADurb.Bin429]|nr:MAG: Inositol-1-monophosphatase [bacterium ADurb.Bin429]
MPELLEVAIAAAREAGALQREGLGKPIEVRKMLRHDVKLEMDVNCEELIRRRVTEAFPDHAILGEEEGGAVSPDAPTWIVDPLDGTANYSRRIPHFCVSIAVQQEDQTLLGVVYDPVRDELFHAVTNGGAFLNDNPIHVSEIATMEMAILAVGFSKTVTAMERTLSDVRKLRRRVHKFRIFGAAALDLAYVAAGRLDGFIENGLCTWDIAAGTLLIREAGGVVALTPLGKNQWDVQAQNGKLW